MNPGNEDEAISLVTVGEIRSLALQLGWGPLRVSKMEEVLAELIVLDINNEVILDRYVAIDAYSQRKHPTIQYLGTPRNMGKNDLWIAATASAFELTLKGTDSDFEHLNQVFSPFTSSVLNDSGKI